MATSIAWLRDLEEKVREASARLRELRAENAELTRRIRELEASGAATAGGAWSAERDEIRQRVEKLAAYLEELLKD